MIFLTPLASTLKLVVLASDGSPLTAADFSTVKEEGFRLSELMTVVAMSDFFASKLTVWIANSHWPLVYVFGLIILWSYNSKNQELVIPILTRGSASVAQFWIWCYNIIKIANCLLASSLLVHHRFWILHILMWDTWKPPIGWKYIYTFWVPGQID